MNLLRVIIINKGRLIELEGRPMEVYINNLLGVKNNKYEYGWKVFSMNYHHPGFFGRIAFSCSPEIRSSHRPVRDNGVCE